MKPDRALEGLWLSLYMAKLIGLLLYLLIAPMLVVWAAGVLFKSGVALSVESWAAGLVFSAPALSGWCGLQGIRDGGK